MDFVVCLMSEKFIVLRRIETWDVSNMIASLRYHYAYLSIITTSRYQCLFTMKYCGTVIAMQ